MDTYGNNKTKINPLSVLGGVPGMFDETEFEREAPVVSAVTQTVGGVVEDFISLGKDIAGFESKTGTDNETRFPVRGSIEFNKKNVEQIDQKKESDRKKAFFQALKEDHDRVEREKDKSLLEEEINDIATNLPTEQKNQLLHYQANYKDRSVYQRAELRKKLIEDRKKAERQQMQEKAAAAKPKGGFKMGEHELEKGGENFGHFTKAVG